MKFFCSILLVMATLTVSRAEGLPRSTPESQGVSSAELLKFVETADQQFDSLNSIMVVRHGHVVAEGWWAPYHAEARHSLYSLSKSFTSTAIGIAISEGKLGIDDLVLPFFPDDAPKEPSENLKKMRVRDLLRMATGHQTEPSRADDVHWVKTFLSHPVAFKPGSHFLYNTPATHMQSAIVQKVSGATLHEYLKPRLFEPLGIENPTWDNSPQGMSIGGYGLNLRTEDIARFGQLYLQKGLWKGKQLVPAEWIAEATSRQTATGSDPVSDWDHGYGYQFWRGRHGAYRGDGAFGQFCIVLPELDAVIAITSGVKDMQAVLNLVWDKLLPAIKDSTLPADDDARGKLENVLRGLALRKVEGTAEPAKVSGKKFVFSPSPSKLEAITLDLGDDSGDVTLVARFDGVEHRIQCGRKTWVAGKTRWGLMPEQPVAACGAWTAPGTFTAKLCFVETPFVTTVTLKFDGNEIRCHSKPNLEFGPKHEFEALGIAGEVAPAAAKPLTTDVKPIEPEKVQLVAAPANTSGSRPPHDFAKWEKAIAAYEQADQTNPPPKGGIVFIGSSTILLWKSLVEDFPDHKVINRGFGGSEIVDSTHFADRIIFPYEPRQIYLRAGGNDIHGGRTPAEVASDFVDFVQKVHSRLPKTEIYYIAVSPAPSRWGETDKYRALNALIRQAALDLPRVGFVDAFDITLGSQGQARKDLFVPDMLHLNPDGYRVLAEAVRPFLPTGK
ncbi:serine hydrolase [Schlesneria paludicola]|uniref:serine hydrolase n=1 Tax=Schlesneria paludicola TaxID=360056 RepID=UPI00029A0D8C|nr:serine hydrolase [Schlesneria paludicola]